MLQPLLDDAAHGEIIQPRHDKEQRVWIKSQGNYKGFYYVVFEAAGYYKGFARATVDVIALAEKKEINIETEAFKTEHSAGKELFARIDLALRGYGLLNKGN